MIKNVICLYSLWYIVNKSKEYISLRKSQIYTATHRPPNYASLISMLKNKKHLSLLKSCTMLISFWNRGLSVKLEDDNVHSLFLTLNRTSVNYYLPGNIG